jgi:lysophospholipase L1-like esterase/acetyl esterase/lipase
LYRAIASAWQIKDNFLMKHGHPIKCTFSLLLLLGLFALCRAATVSQESQAAISKVSKEPPKPGDADFPSPTPSTRHAEKVAAVKAGHYDLVLIGDSIVHSTGELDGKYEPLKEVWGRHYAPRHAINLGYNGYRTEQILWNLQDGELDFDHSPKVALILIGTNNSDDRHFSKVHTAEEIFAGTKAIVELIRQRHPTTRILVLRIFPRGGDGEKGVSPPAFNSSAHCIETCRRAGELTAQLADGKQVFWLDVNHVFLRPDGAINTDLMWDLLHPSPAGAEAWAQAVEPTLAQLMGDQPLAVEVPSNSALIPVPKLENDSYDWYARHADVLRVKGGINPEVVLVGDSITHFWGGEPKAALANGPRSWQSTFGKYRTLNLGFGWDRIQNVLWRLDHGELDGLHPRVIVLHIGTNNTSDTANARQNTPTEIAEGIRAIVQRLRAKAPGARIVLMAVFPREQKPDHSRRQHISEINKLLAGFGQMPGITFLDLGPKLLQPDGSISPEIMRDFCHPTEKGYQIWGEALAPWLAPAAPSGASAGGKPLTPEKVALWPDQAPVGDGTFERTGASVTVYRPQHPSGTAVVICPGGGYGGLVMGAEGSGIAQWLNAHDITGIVLEYRLPRGRAFVPLLDAQRAIRLVRTKGTEWGCDPQRIGIVGFSAGGHLAATAATHFDAGNAAATDPIERVGCRPDFAVLVYPVITMGEKTHGGTKQNLLGTAPATETVELFSNEKQVTAQTPPTFLAHALDDKVVSPDHSRLFYEALQARKVPSRYLELPSGDHGLNGYKGPMWDAWQSGALKWLASIRLIPEQDAAQQTPPSATGLN